MDLQSVANSVSARVSVLRHATTVVVPCPLRMLRPNDVVDDAIRHPVLPMRIHRRVVHDPHRRRGVVLAPAVFHCPFEWRVMWRVRPVQALSP